MFRVARIQLAGYILAGDKPSGDATLVIRNQSYPSQPTISGADLYADNGEYFFAHAASGLLRILSTLPEVTVTSTTTGGQATLTLRAGAPAMPGSYQEALVIGAKTGIPVTFTGGVPGHAPDVTVTYQVTGVTLADIAAGKS
jgi:hypothetical protein